MTVNHTQTDNAADLEWRIYYDDGSTYDNLDGSPAQASKRGVICIVNRDDRVGRHIAARYDYYWWNYNEEEWWGGDHFGLWDYLSQSGEKIVAFGRSVPRETYREIHQRAVDDGDFPKKSAWEDDENRVI